MTTRRLVIVAFVVLGLALAYQMWRRGRAEGEIQRALVAHQRAELEAAKWKRAEAASQDELARTVEMLGDEIVAAREAGVRIGMTSHWQGRGSTKITVRPTPGDQPGEPGERTGEAAAEDPPAGRATVAASTSDSSTSNEEAKQEVEIEIDTDVRIDDAVALDNAGRIYVVREVEAKLSSEGKDLSDWFPVIPEPGNVTRVDPKLQAAWEAAKNPPPRVALFRRPSLWRWGGSCIGGVGYTLVGGRVDGVVACGYGVQF